MVRLTLSIRKSLEDEATVHFEAAKKARRKKDGVLGTIERFSRELPAVQAAATAPMRVKAWYEQYRWTWTSDGYLVIGGRDATTNDVLIKKHAQPGDIVFHTELPGSPFVIIKAEGKELAADSPAFAEAAQFCAAFSKAWKAGLATSDVFWVKPEQLSKTPNSGESLGKGSFIVRGEKHFLRPIVEIALGLIDGVPCAGVSTLFRSRSVSFATLTPGSDKVSDLSKKMASRFGQGPDAWNALLPAGGGKITGWKRGSEDGVISSFEATTKFTPVNTNKKTGGTN